MEEGERDEVRGKLGSRQGKKEKWEQAAVCLLGGVVVKKKDLLLWNPHTFICCVLVYLATFPCIPSAKCTHKE